jgi:outer membrane autotransporter protein
MTNTTAYQHLQTTVMRGGRLTKWKGIAASVAPMVGTIVVAGGLALTSPTALFAGTCTETTGGSGIWTCAGPAGLDTPLNLTSASGGDLDVSTVADFGIVTTTGNAITLTNTTGDGSITFTDSNASVITGFDIGIFANNEGTGALSVTSTGTATGTDSDSSGIYAYNSGNSTGGLTIVSADASGEYYGIGARNYGTGALSVTSTGTATGTGFFSDGIFAYNSGTGTDLTIISADASGGYYGIGASNYGTGATSITVTGDVTGGTSYGIVTQTGAGGMTTITLDNGANVSSAAGRAIYNAAGASNTIVNTGAAVSGDIVLNEGSDNVTFAGGDFSGVTLFDGGDDTDILTFAGSSGTLVGANVTNWENLVIDAGSTISFSDGAVTVDDITDPLTGFAIQAGGTLDAIGGLMLTGNLTNAGSVTMQDGMTGDMITVSGDYTGGGILLLDANTSTATADTLVINGAVLSGGTLVLAQSTTPNVLLSSDLVAVTVVGTSIEGDFVGALTFGAFDYSLVKDGTDFVFSVASQAVNSTGAVYEAAPSVLGAFNRLPTLEQRVGHRQWTGQSGALAEGQPITGAWVRFSGDRLDATTTTGSNIDSSTWGLQAGSDFAVESGDAGQWVLGVTGQYGQVSSTVTSALGFGTIDAEGFGVGATATWYGNTGTYVDLQGQMNWIDIDIASSAAGALATDQSTTAYALSAEVGHQFALNETSALVPQAQLTWGRIDGGAFTDNAANAVDLGNNDQTIGRIGLAYEYTPNTAAAGNPTKAYVIGNILHDFSGDSSVQVGSASLSTGAAQTTWGEIGVGGSYAVDTTKTLYGEAAYRTAFGGSSDNNGLSATLGLQIQW